MFSQYKGLRKELYVLAFGRTVTSLGSMIWPMLTLILSQKMNMSAENVADFLLLFSIVSIPFSLIGGRITDKFNKKYMIIICDFISVLCFLICGFIPLSIKSIILFGVASLFQNIEHPAYEALVADFTSPKDRERAYSLCYWGINLGLVLSPTIGGLLFNDYLNIAFIINGIAILCSTIMIALLIKNINKEYDENDQNEYEKETNESTISFVLKNRVLLLYIVACVIAESVYLQWDYLLPLQLGDVFKENGPTLYGTLTSTNCITVVVATAFLTKLLIKIKEIDKISLGRLLVIVGLAICAIFIKVVPMLYIGIVIFTIGEIICTVAVGSFVSKRVPANHRGRYSSIVTICAGLSSFASKAVGAIYDKFGSNSAWMLVIGLGLILQLILLIIKQFDIKDYPKLYERKQ